MEVPRSIYRLVPLASEASWIIAGQVFAAMGMLVLVRALTEFLQPAEYGRVALALAAGLLVGQTVMAVSVGIGRYYPVAAEADDLHGYAFAVGRMLLRVALGCALLTLLLVTLLAACGLAEWIPLTGATALLALVSGANTVACAIQTAARQRRVVALHQSADAWLRIGAVWIGISAFGPSSEVVVWAYGFATAIVTVSQVRFVVRLLTSRGSRVIGAGGYEWQNKIWAFSSPFVLWGLFTWIQQASDRWALEAFASTADVGRYAVLIQLGYAPIMMVSGMVSALVAPVLFQRAGDGSSESRNRQSSAIARGTALAVVAATVVAFIGTATAHRRIFGLLVSESYLDHSWALPWIVLSAGMFATAQVLALDLMAAMKTRTLLWVKISTAVFGTACNFVGAWLLGTDGVIFGVAAFSATYLLVMCGFTSCKPRTIAPIRSVP